MRAFSVFSAVILLALSTWAATITSPGQNTTWDASKQGQPVAWTSVSTDPPSFTLVLANMGSYPNVNITLKENVVTADNSTMVDAPPSGWPTGMGFQINVVRGGAILAQSQQFDINGTTVAFSSTLRSSGTSTGTSPGSTSTGGGGNGALGLTVQTGFVAGLALAGALLA